MAFDAVSARVARASVDAQRQAMEALGDILIERGEAGGAANAAWRCAALVGAVAGEALRPLDDAASALAAMLRADMADEATAALANALSARADETEPGDGLGRCGLALAAMAFDRRRRAEAATLARFYAPLIDDPGFLRRLRRDLGPRAADEARALLAL